MDRIQRARQGGGDPQKLKTPQLLAEGLRRYGAGWTGLEPAASGVTGATDGIAGPSKASQTIGSLQVAPASGVHCAHPVAASHAPFAAVVLLTVREVAERLQVRPVTIYKLCSVGTLPHVRVSNAIRIPLLAVDTFIQSGGALLA